MKAIEFATAAHDGVITIPQEYADWFSRTVRVILLHDGEGERASEGADTANLHRFFAQFNADLSGYRFDREDANAR